MIRNKRAQEEMIGFALIIVIVAVVLIVFLSVSLRNPSKSAVESYEIEGFIQSFLQYSTECDQIYDFNYINVRETVFSCRDNQMCRNGLNSCEVLSSTLEGIMSENWPIGEDSPLKGYRLEMIDEEGEIVKIEEGNRTRTYKSATQNFVKSGELVEITVFVYY